LHPVRRFVRAADPQISDEELRVAIFDRLYSNRLVLLFQCRGWESCPKAKARSADGRVPEFTTGTERA